jgi:hypothetical protein
MAVTLEEAVAAARRRCSSDEWFQMSPGEQTRLIYREMRRLDLEQANARAASAGGDTRVSVPIFRPNRTTVPVKTVARCQAPVRTRRSGRCSWKASCFIDGTPYCGFHARIEQAHRLRSCAAVAAD